MNKKGGGVNKALRRLLACLHVISFVARAFGRSARHSAKGGVGGWGLAPADIRSECSEWRVFAALHSGLALASLPSHVHGVFAALHLALCSYLLSTSTITSVLASKYCGDSMPMLKTWLNKMGWLVQRDEGTGTCLIHICRQLKHISCTGGICRVAVAVWWIKSRIAAAFCDRFWLNTKRSWGERGVSRGGGEGEVAVAVGEQGAHACPHLLALQVQPWRVRLLWNELEQL